MFQPEVKLEFVRRYCLPANGWNVFVDIDASEEGRTGGERKTDKARQRQTQMQGDADRVKSELKALKVKFGGSRDSWFEQHGLPSIRGDRDIIAFHHTKHHCVIAEVEGDSTAQPEQKLYHAIGQIVMAASAEELKEWKRTLVLVVQGEEIARHLSRANVLAKLGVSALALGKPPSSDLWLFGDVLPTS